MPPVSPHEYAGGNPRHWPAGQQVAALHACPPSGKYRRNSHPGRCGRGTHYATPRLPRLHSGAASCRHSGRGPQGTALLGRPPPAIAHHPQHSSPLGSSSLRAAVSVLLQFFRRLASAPRPAGLRGGSCRRKNSKKRSRWWANGVGGRGHEEPASCRQAADPAPRPGRPSPEEPPAGGRLARLGGPRLLGRSLSAARPFRPAGQPGAQTLAVPPPDPAWHAPCGLQPTAAGGR